jgi:FAD/FMN-containing dehydrogenase
MSELQITSRNATRTTISASNLDAFTSGLRGNAVTRADEHYEQVRSIWNAMIDKKPALIVQALGTADVMHTVNFARENNLLLSVRGGGHNIAGNSLCDGGVMLDFSLMRAVQVDPQNKTAQVEPGALLSDLDHETQAFGLATPVGYNSTTGIAGLTLGGGFGWLSRKYGLTMDNLLSADVVTADGQMRNASASENQDLFWAIRGGGGNFGAVTSFRFQLYDVGPMVFSGPIVHPFEHTAEVLKAYRAFITTAPDEVVCWFVLRHAPPLPFIAEEWHGKKVLILATFYAGDMEDGEKALQPIRDIGRPIADGVGPHPYAAWQGAFDGLLAPGARNYWKSHNLEELTDAIIDTLVEGLATMPTPMSEIACAQLGGAINRIPVDATAYPHRDTNFVMNMHTRWEDPADDERCIKWARDMYAAAKPHATGGVYVNFIPEEVGEEQAAFRENYGRLVEIKKKYDPDNLFQVNLNVKPG